MQVTVSHVSPVEVEVKVSLPKEQVSTALAKAYNQLGKSAQIRGFRRGKAPLPLLKQYFGHRVAAEVTGQLIDETLGRALAEQKLQPVTQPQVKPDHDLQEDNTWSYTAKLEVRPEVGEIRMDGIEVERKVFTVEEADVDHQIEHLREQNATLRTPEPARPVKTGDVVTLDYDVAIEGASRADLAARDRSVEVGKGRLLKEIETGIQGMNLGDVKDIQVRFADDHAREDLRGKDAVLKVTVTEIREKVLPELDDEFAKDVGSDSMAELRAKVRGELDKEAKDMAEQKLREDVVAALAEKNPVAVPPSLVQNATAAMARDMVQSMRMRNEPIPAEQVLQKAQEMAENRVRAGLLLVELARRNNLAVTEDDLDARINEMAKETGKAAAKLRAEHRDPRKREALAGDVLEDKVLALLLSKVSVTDAPAGRFVPEHDHEH